MTAESCRPHLLLDPFQEEEVERSFQSSGAQERVMAQVPVWIEPGVMRLPPEGTPMIMVGPGTGVAPFRAMLEERGLQMQQGATDEACTWACNSQGHSSLMGSFPALRTVLHSAAQLLVVTCRALATCHFLLGMLMS